MMTFLKKLFSGNQTPKERVRVCIECGMPVAQHKDWCAIWRTRQDMERRRGEAAGSD
jgi:hypothetical protein